MNIRKYIKDFESNNHVYTYTFKGLHYWLFIRNHFYTKKFYKTTNDLNFRKKITLFFSVFFGFFNWFKLKKFDFWFFTDSLERRDVEGVFTDKLIDYPASILPNSLVIEQPIFKLQKKVNSKHRVSKMVFIILEILYIKFFLRTKNVANLPLADLLEKEDIAIDISGQAKKMVAQYRLMQFILKIKKPKAVFFVNSYSNYGYIKALKENQIKVIEFQHGVINEHHYGYNIFSDFSPSYFPDYLLCFGEKEREVFNQENKWIDKSHVIPIGSYYIDFINNHIKWDEKILKLKKRYKRTVAVSLQEGETDAPFILFLINVATQNNSILYLLNPRITSVKTYLSAYEFPENIIFMDKLNIYQTIKHADFHSTVYSSCILEAPALGVKNIVLNLNNRAKEYYQTIFDNTQNLIFTENEAEYIYHILNEPIVNEKIVQEEHKKIIAPNYRENIHHFLNNHIV